MAANISEQVTIPSEYNVPEGLRTLANYLRSSNGVKVRSGIEHDKRVDYFKGKKMVECILEGKKWPKSIPQIKSRELATAVCNKLCSNQFFHRSEKIEDKKAVLAISKKNYFEETGYYTWMYAGNMMWSNIATGLVIAVVIGFTLLPIWPDYAKKILWYLSVTFLLATISFCLIRFLLFVITWLFGYDFWIFPRLFDETLSVQDSFKPIFSFTPAATGQGYYRIGTMVCIIGLMYWVMTQPTEFDEFLKAQKGFIDDIYSGNLLADYSQESKDNMDRGGRKVVPSVEDWLREMAEEERLDAPTAHAAANDGGYDEDTMQERSSSSESSSRRHEVEEDVDGESHSTQHENKQQQQDKGTNDDNNDDDTDSERSSNKLNEEEEEEFNDQMLDDLLNSAMEDDA